MTPATLAITTERPLITGVADLNDHARHKIALPTEFPVRATVTATGLNTREQSTIPVTNPDGIPYETIAAGILKLPEIDDDVELETDFSVFD